MSTKHRDKIMKALGERRDVNIQEIVFLEMLLEDGKLKPKHINDWVEDARKRGISYPRLAIVRDLVTESELADMLARQYEVDFIRVRPDDIIIDLGLARNIADADVHALSAIPIQREAGEDGADRITVVTYKVSNPEARERMPVLLNIEPDNIVWGLCSKDEYVDLRRRVSARDDSGDVVEMDVRAGETADDLAARRFVEGMIIEGQRRRASDIHFQPGSDFMTVRMRIAKDMVSVEQVPKELQANIVGVIKHMAGMDQAESYTTQDGHIIRDFGAGPIDIRAATARTIDGEEVELRLMDPATRRMGLDELGLGTSRLETLKHMVRLPDGLGIVSGATGAGKTTTLYALVEYMDDPRRKIWTIEDPVELRLSNASQIQVNPKRGITFTSAAEDILRNDPDVIMVGEVRRPEEANAAISAAETGHLVLTSMHARSAAGVVSRLLKMGIDRALISYAIRFVSHQRLVKRPCDSCSNEVGYTREELLDAGAPESVLGDEEKFQLKVANERGCEHCVNGYKERLLGIHEVLVLDRELKAAIDEGATPEQFQQIVNARDDHHTVIKDFYEKLLAGKTTLEERWRLL